MLSKRSVLRVTGVSQLVVGKVPSGAPMDVTGLGTKLEMEKAAPGRALPSTIMLLGSMITLQTVMEPTTGVAVGVGDGEGEGVGEGLGDGVGVGVARIVGALQVWGLGMAPSSAVVIPPTPFTSILPSMTFQPLNRGFGGESSLMLMPPLALTSTLPSIMVNPSRVPSSALVADPSMFRSIRPSMTRYA
jgi:hypothetical protein